MMIFLRNFGDFLKSEEQGFVIKGIYVSDFIVAFLVALLIHFGFYEFAAFAFCYALFSGITALGLVGKMKFEELRR